MIIFFRYVVTVRAMRHVNYVYKAKIEQRKAYNKMVWVVFKIICTFKRILKKNFASVNIDDRFVRRIRTCLTWQA